MTTSLVLLAIGWMGFGALHSLLVERRLQARTGHRPWRGYRLFYNAFAIATLATMIAWVASLRTPMVFGVAGAAAILLRGGQILGLAIGLGSAWQLGFLEFLGVAQVLARPRSEGTVLVTSGLYALCRNPMGLGFLLMIWCAPRMSWAYLISAACVTAYLVLGTWLEERHLLSVFGEPFARYRSRVPCMIPLTRSVRWSTQEAGRSQGRPPAPGPGPRAAP